MWLAIPAIASLAGSMMQESGQQAAGADYSQYQDVIDKYLDTALHGYTPYQVAGQNAENAMSNPTKYYNDIMGAYSISPFAQYQQNQALGATAAKLNSMGLTGSSGEAGNLERQAQGITQEDAQNYYNNINNIYSALAARGFQGASGAGNLLAQFGQLQGVPFEGQAASSVNQSNIMGNLFAGLGSAFGSAFGNNAASNSGSVSNSSWVPGVNDDVTNSSSW